jgi:hypothetical protein
MTTPFHYEAWQLYQAQATQKSLAQAATRSVAGIPYASHRRELCPPSRAFPGYQVYERKAGGSFGGQIGPRAAETPPHNFCEAWGPGWLFSQTRSGPLPGDPQILKTVSGGETCGRPSTPVCASAIFRGCRSPTETGAHEVRDWSACSTTPLPKGHSMRSSPPEKKQALSWAFSIGKTTATAGRGFPPERFCVSETEPNRPGSGWE